MARALVWLMLIAVALMLGAILGPAFSADPPEYPSSLGTPCSEAMRGAREQCEYEGVPTKACDRIGVRAGTLCLASEGK